MSAISRFFLLVLCLSLHACDGRRLAVLANHKHEKDLKISNQDGQKKISSSWSVSGSHENHGSTSNKGKAEETRHLVVEEAKPVLVVTEGSGLVKKKQTTMERSHKPGALRRSVTWRFPRDKHREEEHPSFDLDYSPPKTHPPSHN